MELRGSRSRSRTPFVQNLQQTELNAEGGEYEETIVRTTRSTTIKSYENQSISTGNAYGRSLRSNNISSKPEKSTRRRTRYRTSDYSSEEGEIEVTSSHVGENEKNQLIEDAKLAANGSSEISALGLYRKAGRYWDIYPKTDWTYSRSSRDRVELAPGVVAMPNMSRRSLHSQERTTEHLLSHHKEQHSDTYSTPKYKATRTLFTDDNYNENYEYTVSSASYRRRFALVERFTSVVVTVYTTILSVLSGAVAYPGSWLLWLGKRVHRAASWLMLWDTWLLRRWDRRRDGKVAGLVLLCLLPLLFFGGWYSVSTLGQAIYGTYLNYTTAPAALASPQSGGIIKTEAPSAAEIAAGLTQEQLQTIALLLKDRMYIREEANPDEILNKVVLPVTDPLKAEVDQIRLELKELESAKDEDLNRVLAQVKAENLRVMHSLRQCCRNAHINVEAYVTRAVRDVFSSPDFSKDREELAKWLHSIFVAKEDLESHLANVTQNLKADFDAAVQTSGEKIMNDVASKISLQLGKSGRGGGVISSDSLTDEHIRLIVKDVLAVYDADKTGLVDYAMEPMGGQVMTTRCTESYQARTAVVSILGVPLWYPSNTPRTVITPGINPGECWAFQNFPGFLVVKLAAPVKISAFSYEHISKKLIANGKIDSAPKDFEVYGLRNETDKDPVLLGSFRYDFDGEPLQFFASVNSELVFDMIELRVLSNHGNPNYTCLYRFRVHGNVSKEPT